MIGFLKKLLILIIFFMVVVFSISNKQNISIGLLPFATRIELPLFLVVIVLIFLGGILGIILAKASNIFNRR